VGEEGRVSFHPVPLQLGAAQASANLGQH